jgi:hypothetical protein
VRVLHVAVGGQAYREERGWETPDGVLSVAALPRLAYRIAFEDQNSWRMSAFSINSSGRAFQSSPQTQYRSIAEGTEKQPLFTLPSAAEDDDRSPGHKRC